MFSNAIMFDPYFHANHDEKTAKEALINATKETILFCPSVKQNEILLVYKAEFQESLQVRIINLNYCERDGSIYHNNLGSHPSMHSVGQALIKFLNGWTSKPFSPIPFIKPSTIQPAIKSNCLIPSMDDDVVKHNIFTLFDKKAMSILVRVCKSWYQAGKKLEFEIEQHEFLDQQHKRVTLSSKIKFIFKNIHEKISPEIECFENPLKVLTYNGFSISKPRQHSSEKIVCNISTPSNFNGNLFFIDIEASEIRCLHSSELLTNEEIEKIEEVCLYGKNPHQDITEKNESDNEVIQAPNNRTCLIM